jgi:uncharacterized protein (TIGR03067 family)
MPRFRRSFVLVWLLLLPAPLLAQSGLDPSGHWEGTIQSPTQAVSIEVDLAKNARGEIVGTFGQSAAGFKGLPLTAIVVEGRSVSFKVKGGLPGVRTFKGTVAADGQSMTGDFNQRVYSTPAVPFTLTRTGNARIDAPASNAPLGQELEGTWNGTVNVGGRQKRLILRMTNRPDGPGTGSVASVEDQLEFPIATITVKAPSVTLGLPSINGSYVGNLNADGTELAGTWTQGTSTAPLTFQRATKALASLQGLWVVTSMNGQSTGDTEVVLAITADAWTSIRNGRIEERGTLKIDPASTPMTFDMVITAGSDQGKTQLGVVEVTGDTMKSKLNTPGVAPRPSDFAIQPGHYVFVARKQ